MTKEYATYLAHHGVKGQKWGVRRYQNEDGTLTAEGIERYKTIKAYNEAADMHAKTAGEKGTGFLVKGISARFYSAYSGKANDLMKEMGFKSIKDLDKAYKKTNNDNKKTTNKKNMYDNLSDSFYDALADNPKLTYEKIYKEMGVDMNSDDPDVYRDAEKRWYKKHGY